MQSHLPWLRAWLVVGIVLTSAISARAHAHNPLGQRQQSTPLQIKLLQDKVGRYERVEVVIVTGNDKDQRPVDTAIHPNHFDPNQFDLRVRFTAPSGKSITVPAFWYQDYDQGLQPKGDPEWRARFTPTEIGAWTVQAEMPKLNLKSASAKFSVGSSANKGFIRVHKQNPRYFAYDNGDLYFPIGLNIAWASGQDEVVLADYTRWFDRLAANGGNTARIWMASWSFGIEWNDTGLGDYTRRLKRAWLLDQVFQLAEQRGITIMLCLLNHGAFSASTNPEWENNPYNRANGGMLDTPEQFVTEAEAIRFFKQRVRYIAARYGYSTSLFAWEWWNEVNWTPIADAELGPWLTEMSSYIQQFDPYRHLITNSYANSKTAKTWSLPAIDFAQQHDYSGIDPMRVFKSDFDEIGASAGAKPILMGEHGLSAGGADSDKGIALAREQIHLHNGIWAASFLGYAGSGMYWWWDLFVDPQNQWKQFKGLAEFIKGEDLTTLTPNRAFIGIAGRGLSLQKKDRALVWVRSSAYEAGEVQLAAEKAMRQALRAKRPFDADRWVYAPPVRAAITLTVNGLSDGPYTAQWYSPATATWLSESTGQSKNGQAVFSVPSFDADIAVKITRKR